MKNKEKKELSASDSIIIGQLIGSVLGAGYIVYDQNQEEINRKVIETYNKILPHIQPYIDTISKVDPDLMQIGVSSVSVVVLSSILVHLIKKDLKKDEKDNFKFSKIRANDKPVMVKNGFSVKQGGFAVKNGVYGVRQGGFAVKQGDIAVKQKVLRVSNNNLKGSL